MFFAGHAPVACQILSVEILILFLFVYKLVFHARAILAFPKAFLPTKRMVFLVFKRALGNNTSIKWCILHRLALLDSSRCVFLSLCFCQLFHLFHDFQHLFIRLWKGLYRSFPCYLMHLARLFHAKTTAFCRT